MPFQSPWQAIMFLRFITIETENFIDCLYINPTGGIQMQYYAWMHFPRESEKFPDYENLTALLNLLY